MKFTRDILDRIGAVSVGHDVVGAEWQAVTSDSRASGPSSVFVAVKGERADGNAFVGAARAAGTPVVVSENAPADNAPWVRVADARRALALLASAAAGDPTAEMLLAGISGTDGKTSTAMMVEAGLAACGYCTGLVGTVVYRYAGVTEDASMTTPDPVTLQNLFARMREQGVGAAAIEVSSHALDQRRVEGCAFDAGAWTNLTRDHLDYHGTVDAYLAAKLRFFSEVLPASPKAKGAVVNGDDARIVDAVRAACPLPVFRFSNTRRDVEIHPTEARFGANGIRARVATPWGEVRIDSALIGPHNLANMMTAIGLAGVLNVDVRAFAAGVSGLRRIPGRLERVEGRRNVHVFVDYSHTPKSIENVLTVLRPLVGSARISIVAGAGGDRDRGKRPLMGRAAALLADEVFVTSDNPRSEDPMAIIDEIVSGIDAARAEGLAVAPVEVEPDRREAIRRAINASADGDVVVVAGKGHEDYQIIGTQRFHFSDVAVAKEFLDR